LRPTKIPAAKSDGGVVRGVVEWSATKTNPEETMPDDRTLSRRAMLAGVPLAEFHAALAAYDDAVAHRKRHWLSREHRDAAWQRGHDAAWLEEVACCRRLLLAVGDVCDRERLAVARGAGRQRLRLAIALVVASLREVAANYDPDREDDSGEIVVSSRGRLLEIIEPLDGVLDMVTAALECSSPEA
jgi:hypothetical protein